MFVHVDATAACREGHAGNEQKDHQSEYCFLLHICYNGGESILLFSVVKSNCIFHFSFFIFNFFVYLHFILVSIMKRLKTLSIVILLVLCGYNAQCQVQDSVDVLDYDIALDLSDGVPFHGEAVVTLQLLRLCDSISLDLIGTLDSLEMGGIRSSGLGVHNSRITIPTSGIAAHQTFTLRLWYTCWGYVENYGWGGMHMDNNVSYNLGVGFETNPHVIGRAFFPCRDNFHDKATYTLRMKARTGWTAECGGIRQSVDTDSAGCEHSVWRINHPTPTYLVSVSQSNWTRIYDTIHSTYGDYPLTLGYRNRSETSVRRAFTELDSVVPMFERCFGPYRWERIGYIATEKGSMEHVNNIALDQRFIASMSEPAQTTIAHELGHAWFGNLVTCETEEDMWINEGGASFTSEVAMEAVSGRTASDDYYQRYLEEVLRTTHITDNGYRALTPMPHDYTYGSTVYKKGWMVWHSLRGYLGDSVFYASLNRLMERCAFGNIDSYRLRDSLSLYSGVDLTDFFDFHVLSPGFVDYRVEYWGNYGFEGNVFCIHQQSVGTTQSLASHRVPVTIFYYNDDDLLDSTKRWVDFTGSGTSFNIGNDYDLGFTPAFCVLDRNYEISDAATLNALQLTSYAGTQTLPLTHLKVRAADSIRHYPKYLYAEHHMAPAMGEMPEGVVRRANRYWMLQGQWDVIDSVKGSFRFVRGAYSNSSYPNLDRGFYTNVATVDSLGLFYRHNRESSWQLVSRTYEGNANEGWLVAENILPGEYTLAVVDFEHLAIQNSQHSTVDYQLFPNPIGKSQPLTIKVDTEMPFSVTIVDTDGRTVWHRDGCRNGQSLYPSLPKGTYIVQIENKNISIQSKLIQL